MRILIFIFLIHFKYSLCYGQYNAKELKIIIPTSNLGIINTAYLSPDEKKIITTCDYGRALLWDIASNKVVKQFQTYNNYLDLALFCPKQIENMILLCTEDSIFLNDIFTGAIIHKFRRNVSIKTNLPSFSPDGSYLVIPEDNQASLYEANNLEIKYIFNDFDGILTDAAFTKNSNYLVLLSQHFFSKDSNSITILDTNKGREIITFKIPPGTINGLSVNPNNENVLVSYNNGFTYVFNINNGKVQLKLNYKNESLVCSIFSSNGDKIITATEEGNVIVWDSKNGNLIRILNDIKNVLELTISSDDKFILITSAEGAVMIYDIQDGHLLKKLNNHTDIITSAKFNSKNTDILTTSVDKKVYLSGIFNNKKKCFNGYTLLPEKTALFPCNNQITLTTIDSLIFIFGSTNSSIDKVLFGHKGHINSLEVTPDGTKALTASEDKTARIWDLSTGSCLQTFDSHKSNVNSAVFSKSGSMVITSSFDSTVTIYDCKTGKILKNIKEKEWLTFACMSPDEKTILIASSNILKLYDYETAKLKVKLECNWSGTIVNSKPQFSPCGNYVIYISTSRNSLKIYDLKKQKQFTELGNKNKLIEGAYYNHDGTLILIINSDNTISMYDSNNFNEVAVLKGHEWWIQCLDVSYDSKIIVSTAVDNAMIYWDSKTGNPIFLRYFLQNNNSLLKLPNSPYYMCTKDASKMLHYVTPSLKVIGFEQLDPVYNRPDIVLDSIGKYFGGADQELVANYRQSWEKRIDRLGLDKEKLGKGEIAVPNAEIVCADEIAYENKEGKLNIKVSANDSKYPLRRFNVFVNEVPLYGSAGISIAQLKKQVWDTTVSVPLSVGENKIQVSVMNELGFENFKYPTYVNYTTSHELIAKTYYIGIGVNEFKESIHNLKYCVKDVSDLAQSFGGPNTEVKLFTNQQVTKDNILALKAYLNKTTINDKVIISCSSHGLLDDSLNFYLAMHDVDFDNPKARGLKYEELENLLDGIAARQKLLLLDACNSGENDKTEVLKKDLAKAEKQKETSELAEYKNKTKGVIIQLEEENKKNFKKMNELFVNVRNNTGSVIISAAGGQESALEAILVEGKTIENGAFTYSILECLEQNKGKELKVNTLKQYAEKRVEEITNGKQKPTSRQETMEINWKIIE